MKEEFDLQGQDFATRGKRLNEMIPALRELWKGGWVEWHGEYYDIPAMTLEPHPPTPVPIYTGGHTDAALRRAARYADGWIGNAYPWAEAEHHVGRLKEFLAAEEPRPVDVRDHLRAVRDADGRHLPAGRGRAGRHRHDVHAVGDGQRQRGRPAQPRRGRRGLQELHRQFAEDIVLN